LQAARWGQRSPAALIKEISTVIDPKYIERNWGKTSGGPGKKKLKQIVVADPVVDDDEEDADHGPRFSKDVAERIKDAYEVNENGAAGFDDYDLDGDDDEEAEDADEFEEEQAPVLPKSEPVPVKAEEDEELSDDDTDFDDEDLAKMFANLKNAEGDELDW
jgi:hypothetical protein